MTSTPSTCISMTSCWRAASRRASSASSRSGYGLVTMRASICSQQRTILADCSCSQGLGHAIRAKEARCWPLGTARQARCFCNLHLHSLAQAWLICESSSRMRHQYIEVRWCALFLPICVINVGHDSQEASVHLPRCRRARRHDSARQLGRYPPASASTCITAACFS